MLMGIMGHFTDDEAYPIVSRLQAGLPPGSYFADTEQAEIYSYCGVGRKR